MTDAVNGEAAMTMEESQAYIQNYFMTVLPAQNAEASKAWLAEVEKENGVQKTESGLLYRINRKGDESLKPLATDIVNVDYEGTLRDGSVFDSSYQRGEPIEFSLSGVIKGWTEGLQLIGKGGEIILWIPADLAYGARGAGSIGPNEALRFKVELHDIKSGSQPESAE
jgi:FKBP-type peptidyl-prolyl cis-trans isomerase FkpA